MLMKLIVISFLIRVNCRPITLMRDCDAQVTKAFFAETDFEATTLECENRMTPGCFKSDLNNVRMKWNDDTNKTDIDIVKLKDIKVKVDLAGPFSYLDTNCYGMVKKQVSIMKFCGIEILTTEGRVRLESNGQNAVIYSIDGNNPKFMMFTNTFEFDLGKSKGSINVICGSNKLNDYFIIDREYLCHEFYAGFSYMPELFYKPMCKYPIMFLTLFILVICSVCVYLISSTPVGYLVYIIFYPVLKLFFYFTDKYVPRCKSCRLIMHPFSKCGTVCKCGENFGNTQKLKAHNSGSVDCKRKIMMVYKTNISLKTIQLLLTLWMVVLLISYIPVTFGHLSNDLKVVKTEIKYVTIQDGKAISASVELDFKAIRNNKLLIQPTYKKSELAHIVIKVTDAYYTNNYNLQYITGPIVDTHYVWSYSCTSPKLTCEQEDYSGLGDMTVNKNATKFCYDFNKGDAGSGLEQCDWVCLGQGHAYGICNTMIDFKWRTYKKETNLDKSVVILDVKNGNKNTYYLESDKGTYEFEMGSIDIKSQDVNVLDQKIMIDDSFQVYAENFNEIGQTSNGCGKIQSLINGDVIGKKINDVQKTCAFLSAPKLKINRCLDDTMNVCGLGKKFDLMQHIINYGDLEKITLNKTAYIGDAKLILKIGDVLIQNNEGSKLISADVNCNGCYDCVVGSSCIIEYETTDEMYCDLLSNVTKEISRVYLKTGKSTMSFKIWTHYQARKIYFKICNIEVIVQPNLEKGETIYQLLHKEDKKISVGTDVSHCNTILCHLQHEAIVIYESMRGFLSFLTTGLISYIFYSILTLVLILVLISCFKRKIQDEYARYKQV
ncbi:glycoprotein precursor [Herbert virus strain F23/CI/2004]|uniref:Envelopment polyprotein n=1 Tax=Herbert virus strain F23/CI/2004 TaxID=1230253 RepID=U5F075_9VIRU|nr:glycoprotein precursor [Herbert virus strain F23/CI/2004]AFR34024.1 glycoprotein precursor [Herbert virus strain F23/CI/2004]